MGSCMYPDHFHQEVHPPGESGLAARPSQVSLWSAKTPPIWKLSFQGCKPSITLPRFQRSP